MMNKENEIRKTYQMGVIIALAFILSLATYIILVEILKSTGKVGLGNLPMATLIQLRYIFYGVGVIAIILTRLLRGKILRKSPVDTKEILLNRLLRALMISYALSEVPALLGLALFLLGGLIRDFYTMTVISFVLMFMYFPRSPHWQEWVSQASDDNSREANCCYPR